MNAPRSTRSRLRALALCATAFTLSLALTACSAADEATADVGTTDDVAVADTGRSDIGTFDDTGATPDTGADAGDDTGTTDAGADASEDVTPDVDPSCTGAGCPCDTDMDCDGACVGGGTESVLHCADLCGEGCPDGYACVPHFNYADRVVEVCVPETPVTCGACEVDSDCAPIGSACAELADGRFCLLPCGPDGRCADGTECSATGTTDGLCAPDAGVCTACVDGDADGYGVGDECDGRDCDDAVPTTYDGAPELCNGVDDDCDLDIDEGYDLTTDPANCGACGIVCGFDRAAAACVDGDCQMGACDDGWDDCNDDPADGCETDLTDPATCGVCGELPGVPGESCGTCGTGTWACGDDGGLVCQDDAGDGALNACGGCAALDTPPGGSCGTCGSGTFTCDGGDAVTCAGDAGDRALNACGGCMDLAGDVGDPCGPCDDGALACSGTDAFVCEDASADSDADGVCDGDDVCPGFDDGIDPDGDGVPTGCDECPADNPDDPDGDGVCGPATGGDPETFVIAEPRNRNWTAGPYFRGNSYQATANATLLGFEQYLGRSGSCDIGIVVMESTVADTGPWTVLASTTTNVAAGTGYVVSPDYEIPIVAGRFYALGIGWACSATYYGDQSLDWRGVDAGIGLYRTTVWDNSYAYSPGYTPPNDGSSGLAYNQRIHWAP